MNEFQKSILTQLIEVIESGNHKIVLWGMNNNTISIASELNKLGLLQFVTSVVAIQDDISLPIYDIEVISANKIMDVDFDTLVICDDEKKEDSLILFNEVDSRKPRVVIAGVKHMEFDDPVFHNIYESCLIKSYANGYKNTLIHIYQSIKYLAENDFKGNVVEFGMFKGGTTIFIAKTLKHFGLNDAVVYGFDTFGGFPPQRSVFDLYSNPKCEFRDYDAVEHYCEPYNIKIIKGDICDTCEVLKDEKLMLTFFDTDNYSPSKKAIEICYERTVKGGVLVFDHFTTEERFIYTIGERMAAKEILKNKSVFNLHDTGIFLKTA